MQDAADHSRDCGSATVQHHACRTAAHQLMKSHFSQKLASSTGRPVVVVAQKEAMPGEEAEPRSKSLGRLVMCSHCSAGTRKQVSLHAVTGKVAAHFRWPPKSSLELCMSGIAHAAPLRET